MIDRQRLAELWWELMQIPREHFFADRDDHVPVNLTEDAQVMSPGYVGRTYEPGGWLLVGHFPAGGTEGYVAQRDPGDQRLYDAFRGLRDAGGDQRRRRDLFDAMSDIWIENQSKHRIYSNLIRHALDAGALRDHDAAFLNVFPYRTKENKRPTSAMLRRAWSAAVSRQIEALRPGRLVALGVAVADALDTLYEGRIPITVLRRSNGDHYLTDEARRAIEGMRAREKDRGSDSSVVAPAVQPRSARQSEPVPATHSLENLDYRRILQELGFEPPKKGLILKHWKPIPSIYFNIKRDGLVYFTTHRKDAELYSGELWIELSPQQTKDDKQRFITRRPRPGKERAAFEALLS